VNRVDCTFVDTWLDDWLVGRLPDEVARHVEEHVRECERCRRLAAIVRDAEAMDLSEAGGHADLLPAVLDRTTGSPCARAEELLPALVDDELDADSREILQTHVSHCEGCSRLLAVLEESRSVLPALAELQTPAGLTERVLEATSRGPQRSAFARGGLPSAASALGWQSVLARPRASLELAYIGTALIVVLLGNPVAAFRGAGEQAGRLAGAVPVARLTEQLLVKEAAVGTMARLFGRLTAAANAIATEISERWRQARALINEIETTIGDAIKWLATADLRQAIRGAEQALQPRGQPAPEGQQRKR
jgi:anti-sigma factor RsiW